MRTRDRAVAAAIRRCVARPTAELWAEWAVERWGSDGIPNTLTVDLALSAWLGGYAEGLCRGLPD